MDSGYKFLNHFFRWPCKYWEKSLIQISSCSISISCTVFKFSVKLTKVFIMFCKEVLKDLRQAKGHLSTLGISCNGTLWKIFTLISYIMRLIWQPLVSGISYGGSRLKLDVQDGDIFSIHREGYTRLNLCLCLE